MAVIIVVVLLSFGLFSSLAPAPVFGGGWHSVADGMADIAADGTADGAGGDLGFILEVQSWDGRTPIIPILIMLPGSHPAAASGVCRTRAAATLLLVLLPEPTRLLPVCQKLSGRLDEGGTQCGSANPREEGMAKMNRGQGFLLFVLLFAVAVMSGCATMPTGPSVTVFPGYGKPFEAFQADDSVCRQWASQQIGTSPNDAANQNLAGGAALGTIIGAGLGAAIGAAYGNHGPVPQLVGHPVWLVDGYVNGPCLRGRI